MLEELNTVINKQIEIAGEDPIVYYNGETSALLLFDDRIVGVRFDGTVTVATGYEWETIEDTTDEDETDTIEGEQ